MILDIHRFWKRNINANQHQQTAEEMSVLAPFVLQVRSGPRALREVELVFHRLQYVLTVHQREKQPGKGEGANMIIATRCMKHVDGDSN